MGPEKKRDQDHKEYMKSMHWERRFGITGLSRGQKLCSLL
jgi:hypothetical protein